MKRIIFLSLLLCLALRSLGQPASGYYTSATGHCGADLKTALHHIIEAHTVRTYTQLWDDFRSTDRRPDGKVWDMYSNMTNFTFGDDQAGNYTQEGEVYNREHSFPKSWFNEEYPMYTDLHHIVPTDGYVNNRRGNLPFGETDRPAYASAGSWSLVGPSSTDGYSGTVFEPNDEYKGDFARIYFYMVTCYEDKVAGWESPMLASNAYPAYTDWALRMLMRWAADDPVSPKETERNNSVCALQGNRNPFVDFPGLEEYVWGAYAATPFDPEHYEEPLSKPAAPAVDPASGSVIPQGSNVTIGGNVAGLTVRYALNNGDEQSGTAPVEVPIYRTSTLYAFTVSGAQRSDTVRAAYYIKEQGEADRNLYVRTSSQDELTEGGTYLVVSEDNGVAMSAAVNGKYRDCADVTLTDDHTVTTETNQPGQPVSFTLEGGSQSGTWALHDNADNIYLALNHNENQLNSAKAPDTPNALWTISIAADGTATIKSAAYPKRSLLYNAQDPRFACYQSAQAPVALYRKASVDAIATLPQTEPTEVTVFTIDGRPVRTGSSLKEALRGLPAGLYIANGQKIFIE